MKSKFINYCMQITNQIQLIVKQIAISYTNSAIEYESSNRLMNHNVEKSKEIIY